MAEQILMDYVKPELLVLILVLWYIGSKIKETSLIKDEFIPFILMVVSIFIAASYVLLFEGFTGQAFWIGVMQGLVIATIQGWLYSTKKQVDSLRR